MKSLKKFTDDAKGFNLYELKSVRDDSVKRGYLDRIEVIDKLMEEKSSNAPEVPVTNIADDVALAKKYVQKAHNTEKRGIDFDLTFTQYKSLLNRKVCYYTGIKLTQDGDSPTSLTLDRIDSEVGYTKENTVPCSLLANRLKNELFEHPSGSLRIDMKAFKRFAEKVVDSK